MKGSHVALIVGGIAVVGAGAYFLLFRARPAGTAQAGAVANTAYMGGGQYYPFSVPQAQRLDNSGGSATNQPWAPTPTIAPVELTGLQALNRDITSGLELVSNLGSAYETASDLWSGISDLF